MKAFEKLRNKSLSHLEKPILWFLCNGELQSMEPGELARMRGYVGLDGRAGHLLRMEPSTTVVSRRVFSRSLKGSQAPRERSRTYHALVRMIRYKLVSGRPADRGKEGERIWKLTDWGRAVVKAYQEEIRSGEKCEWERERIYRAGE